MDSKEKYIAGGFFIVLLLLCLGYHSKVFETETVSIYAVVPQTSFVLPVEQGPPPFRYPPYEPPQISKPIWTNDYWGWPPYSNNMKYFHRDTRPRAGIGPAPSPRPSLVQMVPGPTRVM